MERGLVWLPLLGLFIWLAWQGWNEYKKVEVYQTWASQFEKAKFDIYAVIGQSGDHITYGKPTRQGIVNTETFSLNDVATINLLVDNQLVDLQNLPNQGRNIALEFEFKNSSNSIKIPFTEVSLAGNWGKYLREKLS